MDEQRTVQRNLALQRQWYGEPMGDRVRRLVVALDVSQAQLADTLGISAPMLSQVMSGRRAKIGNPSVLARLVMLERRVLSPAVSSGDPSAIAQVLDDVREANPTVSRGELPDPLAELRAVATPEELRAAAALLTARFPELSALLRRAAEPD
ncbi:XRE family transcriptional regulator [Pseudonocardiaceae bacterium YIM PH 21723]|nr:XRE family transcriptional regulator [Pseudonocardiaceae bacterium YIM PH 21723]